MSDNFFPVRHSQLNPSSLKDEVIKRYELHEPIRCRFFDMGINDIYVVNTKKECYYLRVSQTGMHNKCDYEEETNIIITLSKNGIRVAEPVCCRNGNFVWEINAPEGKRYAVLFKEAKNKPSDDNIKKLYNFGYLLAQIHTIADEKEFDVSRESIDLIHLAKKPLKLLQPYLLHRQLDYKYLCNSTNKLCEYVEKNFGFQKPYYGYCHGDIHSGNVFFEGDQPKVFDFDCMGYGWRAYDICVFAWNETFGDENYIEKDEWKSFLNGYNSVRLLSKIELESINVFAALRELWMMGLHAEVMEKNAGCSWYNDDYFDYQIGIFKLWYDRAGLKL